MRASAQTMLITLCAQTDQLLTGLTNKARTGRRGLADAILFGRHHPLHANIKGRGAAMNLCMGDKTLFDPEHIQCFHPVRPTPHDLGLRHQQAEKAFTITRWDSHLIGMFTRE